MKAHRERAAEALCQVAEDPSVHVDTRVAAAKYLLEFTAGDGSPKADAIGFVPAPDLDDEPGPGEPPEAFA